MLMYNRIREVCECCSHFHEPGTDVEREGSRGNETWGWHTISGLFILRDGTISEFPLCCKNCNMVMEHRMAREETKRHDALQRGVSTVRV
jgi:hypothetical protein